MAAARRVTWTEDPALARDLGTTMQLPDVKHFALNRVTLALVDDVALLARTVNDLRPLPPETVEVIQRRLLGERTYNSNAIEGSTLTLRETMMLLQTGDVLGARREREAREAINLASCLEHVQTLVAQPDRWWNQTEFLSIHKRLLTGIDDGIAGRLRDEDVLIRGAKHQPPDPMRVPALMAEFFQRLDEGRDLEGVCLATWAHWAIARIHPFSDGNGRMARLWQDLLLFGRGLTAAMIRVEERTAYYRALTSADDGDLNPLAQMVARRVVSTFQEYVAAQQEIDTIKGWAESLVGDAVTPDAQGRQLDYLRWSTQLARIQDAFERCAAQVTRASSGQIEIQVESQLLIDQGSWELLRTGAGARRHEYFRVVCRRHREVTCFRFSLGRHEWTRSDSSLGEVGPHVALFVAEDIEPTAPPSPAAVPVWSASLREVLVLEDRLAQWTLEVSTGNRQFEDDIDPVKLAQDFLAWVVRSRLP